MTYFLAFGVLIAIGLAIFAFVDRKGLEADVAALQSKVDGWEDATNAKLRHAVVSAKADLGNRIQTLETRATALEKKTQASVQGAVNKAKAQVNGAVANAKKRL